jgi:hypothetical protein
MLICRKIEKKNNFIASQSVFGLPLRNNSFCTCHAAVISVSHFISYKEVNYRHKNVVG